jgi:SAM-dependent methyltransferase
MKKNWDDPYYKYVITKRKRSITIDVTKSIPSFKVPSPGVSDVVALFKKLNIKTVLDFGAGKLRNTLYLLHNEFKVWAVEFKEAFETFKGQERLKEAQAFNNPNPPNVKSFFYLEYPKDFLNFKETIDAALLINVVNIVPEESDRKKILEELAKRIRSGGLLFIMTQYGEPHYKPGVTKRLRLNDGWCYGLHRNHQTFYKEYSIPEIKKFIPDIFFKKGEEDVRKISAPHHRAFLYERI